MKAVTGLNISIKDDGTILFSAGDYEADGQLWAIEPREISIEKLRSIANILGEDAVSGVEKRLSLIRQRLVSTVNSAEFAIKRANEAKAVLSDFDKKVTIL